MKLGTKILIWVIAFFLFLGAVIYLMTFLKPTDANSDSSSESETEGETEAPPIELALEGDLAFVLSSDKSYYSVTGLAVASGAHKIEIPSEHEGKPVKAIGENAFASDSLLSSVTIPDTVKRIGSGAFASCSNLSEINIPKDIEYLGSGALDGCDSLKFTEYGNALYFGNTDFPYTILISALNTDIKSCNVHEDTKVIYDFAFASCTELCTVTLPNGLMQIGADAFADCYSLEYTKTDSACYLGSSDNPYLVCIRGADKRVAVSYILEESTKIIAPAAFIGCTELKDIKLPNSVLFIGAFAFEDCDKLVKIGLDTLSPWEILGYEDSISSTVFDGNSTEMLKLLTDTYLDCSWIRK